MATVKERRSKKLPPVKKPQAPIKSGATRMRVSDKIKRDASAKRAGGSFPIVGVGASAGGLEAFTRLLKQLPVDSGMGFVLVQHLDPVHESALTKLLSKATRMPVREVTNNARVETDHVYVIPPNTSMSIVGGRLKLFPRKKTDGQHRSIDFFFQALAEDQHERSIGVILSGTASDGSLGCEAIKAEGGITFAQDDSAKYDSMPRSAIAAGCIDFVLSPENIARELARIAKHPYVVNVAGEAGPALHAELEREADQHGGPDAPLASGGRGTPFTGSTRARAEAARKESPASEEAEGFKKILLLLRNHCGVDFGLYKSSTIQRRVTRRLVLNKHNTLNEYAAFLKGNTKELDALYSDVLISVTSFFRNPEAFETLKRKVFPKLLAKRGRDEPVRVWVLGCSTGQEAYSIAMSFAEFTENVARAPRLQIFATDLNDALLDKARHGLYARTLAEDVSPERLRRFFVEEEGGYRMSKVLREQVVFARQNVISDPPFSRMDLISCRNLLIYLEAGLQKKIMPAFHYALKPGGFLFLGASESTVGFTDLFEPLDKKQKIFSKKAAPTPAFRLPLPQQRVVHPPSRQDLAQVEMGRDLPEGWRTEREAQLEADRISVSQFAPPGVLINANLQVLQFRGATGAFLEPPPGKASFDVLKMARPGLMLPLRAAVNQAKRANKRVRRENVRVKQNGGTRAVDLQVIPLKNLKERCYLVLFEERKAAVGSAGVPPAVVEAKGDPKRTKKGGKMPALPARRITELERELAETRDYLQSTQEQHEAANEELQASSEEVQSANEELQSINEELETSKEELESTNEELTTVNEEMVNRNQELNRLNSDLHNLHTSVNMTIVVLGRDLTIRRFTPVAAKELNLLASDVGQPIGRIKTNLDFPGLEALIAEVIKTVSVREQEVPDKEGRCYSLRVQPYLTVDNKIDGAVLVLVNITELKRVEQRIRDERNYAQSIIRTVGQPLVVLDDKLRVSSANEAFYRGFQVSPEETKGRLIYELGNRQWDIPALRLLLEEILPRNNFFADYEVTHNFESIGTRTMLLSGSRLEGKDGTPARILLSVHDITERKQTEQELVESEAQFRQVANTMPQIVWAARADGYIDYYNERWYEFTGFPRDVFGQSSWEPILHPDDVERTVETYFGCVRDGKPYQIEYRFKDRTHGSYRWFMGRALPVRNDGGEIIRWFGTCTDIDDQKQVEVELKELMERERKARAAAEVANRVKDEFLAMVSHELRTPLNAIAGWARLLMSGKLDQETSQRAVETIDRNAGAQATIINELLDTARIVSGKLQLEQQAVNLAVIIEEAMDVVRPASEAKGIEMEAAFDSGAGPVVGDAVRLQQVIWNLLSNAVKFTPREGRIEVSLKRAGSNTAIVVSDSGQGISPDFLPHIFERFQQADNSERRQHGGLGLGLSIARHLVEMHGGRIKAESEGENKGSTFTITLPIMAVMQLSESTALLSGGQGVAGSRARTIETHAGETTEEQLASDVLSGLKVLVVDDQTDTRELLTFALLRYGAEIRICRSASQALDVVPQWKPDVIVSDIGMPGEDGYAMMKKIRALNKKRGGTTPAVALTGYASPADEVKALAAGYQAHLAKPVGLVTLAKTVAELAGRT